MLTDCRGKRTIMTRLQDAQKRLENALTRLEKATAAPRGDGKDTEQLIHELATARQRCNMLDGRTREVSQRLDGAIGRIRTLLEE